MIYLGIFIFALVYFVSPAFRCCVGHPIKSIRYAVLDLIEYFRMKYFNLCPTGALDIFCGYFGSGKTLSAVHKVVGLYNRYNDLTVWDRRQKKFVKQRILILSNVSLSVPYVPLEGLAQVVAASKVNARYDDEHGTLTVTIVLMDELSVQMNSREFKSNFNAYFLNTLLCCRHYHISFYGTSQRFAHCDKLLRDVTHNVVQCKKIWRFQVLSWYDAWQLENAQNPELVQPVKISAWFVRNTDYAAYDTLAVVGNLEKSFSEGDMLSEAEILANQVPGSGDLDRVTKPSRKLKRLRKG